MPESGEPVNPPPFHRRKVLGKTSAPHPVRHAAFQFTHVSIAFPAGSFFTGLS
jgi:hypothetical protein